MKRTLPKFFTESQMVNLVLAPDLSRPEGLRDRALLSMACATALRASELCALRVRDVTDRLVFVRCGKGGSQRYVPISQAAFAAVQTYLAAYPARSNEPLFRTGPGRPLTRRRLHKALARYEQSIGLSTGVHILRNSAATRWLNRGLSLPQVQHMLGHVELATTGRYLGVATDTLVRDYRRCLEPQAGGERR